MSESVVAEAKKMLAEINKQLEEIEKEKQKLKRVVKMVKIRVPRMVADIYMEIAKSGVMAFYDDYNPLYYERSYELYNAYTVDIKEGEIPKQIRYTAENMAPTHRADNEYVLNTSLRLGYHGGADIGMGYRWGIRFNSKKSGERFVGGGRYNPACKSNSPMEMINSAIQERYEQGFDDIIESTFNNYWEEK